MGDLGCGVPPRAVCAVEYVAAMRRIWRDDPAPFSGEHVSFHGIRVHPKPQRPGGVPVFFGGNSDRALERVAAHGDGWYGFYLDGVAGVRDRVEALMQICAERRSQRPPTVAVSLIGCEPSDVQELAASGVDELVIVDAPPAPSHEVDAWVSGLAARWIG